LRGQLREDRMFAYLASFYALVALLLGAIGIFGLAASWVTGRTPEIGLRMALGARPIDVLWLIMRDTQALVVAGVLVGTAASLGAGHLIRGVLFGLVPWDTTTLACAICVLLTVGAIASYLPARRAMRVDPMVALRHE